MELNKIYVGAIFGIIIFLSFFLFLNDGALQYSTTLPSGYNHSFLAVQSTLSDINQTTSEIQTQLSSITAQSGLLDYLGFFFNAGYKALTSAIKLVSSFFTFTDESLTVMGGAGAFGSTLKVALYSSLIVLFFIGIILHAIIKSDRM